MTDGLRVRPTKTALIRVGHPHPQPIITQKGGVPGTEGGEGRADPSWEGGLRGVNLRGGKSEKFRWAEG